MFTNMEWRVFFKHKNKTYRAFKISQGNNLDLIIAPKNSIYLPKEITQQLKIGDEIKVEHKQLNILVDHYTMHPDVRHVRSIQTSPPHEQSIGGWKLASISKAIPLVTMLFSTNKSSEEEPKKKWFGFSLPDDVNYFIVDLIAYPKNYKLGFEQNFKIRNKEKPSNEGLDQMPLEMENCNVEMIIRSTNYSFCNIPFNILFQQAEGKSMVITRVENDKILAQATELSSLPLLTI